MTFFTTASTMAAVSHEVPGAQSGLTATGASAPACAANNSRKSISQKATILLFMSQFLSLSMRNNDVGP
jgi:hypothetical protein